MCGIAGIVRFDGKPIEPATLDAMQRAIKHRGPDGEGRYVTPRCALLHARLSIIDIAGGAQPMHVDADEKGGALTVVFNGEIYNHRELRSELVKLGHKFVTDHSDTEVLLHGYREWGLDLFDKIRGMFAIAIWDEAKASLLLTRDLSGKKPLFVRRFKNNEGVAFASVPAALLESTELVEINPDSLSYFLALGYPRASLAANIDEVSRPFVEYYSQDRVAADIWWTPASFEREGEYTALGLADAASQLVTKAVVTRLEADVPLGCFLSGGIDSSIIAAIAHRALMERGDAPLRTFNVAMPDAAYDESLIAERIARKLGTCHQTLRVDPSANLFNDLAYLISLTGEPIADSSVLPTYWICKTAREHVKVVLSGDGGDEKFGGYDRYRAMRLLERHGQWLRRMPLGTIGAGSDGRSLLSRIRRLARAAKPTTAVLRYEQIIRLFSDEQITELAPGLPVGPVIDSWSANEIDSVFAAMTYDRIYYLAYDVLRKVDRASMAVGLEVRSPFLDRDVHDFVCRLTTDQLMPHGRPKAILRQLAAKLVGPDIASLPKRGFGLPIGGWFATTLHDELRQRLMDGPLDTLGFQKPVIQAMLDEHKSRSVDHTHRLFALLALSMWVESVPGVRMAEAAK
jgi:asparagine synthase (glutamine-hydrolysing)